MIVNNFVVSYIVMIFLSLCVCIPAAFVGWKTARALKRTSAPEAYLQMEKMTYLVITLLSLGFVLRIFMVPLWFFTLQELMPYVPGAMCIAGVHKLAAPASYFATFLKFFIPLAYIYWLVLNAFDRRIEAQPFLKAKLMLILPLACLMAFESYFDISFLLMIKPHIVSCCTTMFDVPRSGAIKFIRQAGALWMILFYSFLGVTLFWLKSSISGLTGKIVSAITSLLTLIFLVFTLHTKFSPLILEAPYHQCVFCLWQGFPDIAIASIALIAGLWLAFVLAAAPGLKDYPRAYAFSRVLKSVAFTLCVLGALWLTLRFALKSFITPAFAQSQVTPCQLPNPDQDTLRIFPDRTNYRTEFIRIDEAGDKRGIGAEALYRQLEERIGDKWDPAWEPKDLPYVFYEILKGPERIGWIFGANQGWPGTDNCQIMCRFDLDDRVIEFYFQKLPSSAELRSVIRTRLESKEFYSQFIGLTLENFYIHEQLDNLRIDDKDIRSLDMISRMFDTTGLEKGGFLKTLRGMKMIFVLIDDLKFDNKVKKDEVFEKTKYLVEHKDEFFLLGPDALSEIRKVFPEASRFTVDLVSLKGKRKLIEENLEAKLDPAVYPEEMVYPVYIVYKDEVYKDPFVRGIILGYALPLRVDTPQARLSILLGIGAMDKEKGKIVSIKINGKDIPKTKGLSLAHFYTKDLLLKLNIADRELDKISSLGSLKIDGQTVTAEVLRSARLGLVIVDEFYSHNFFRKKEITAKIEEYLKNKEKENK